MLDLVLAIGHHLLIFGIFGILFAEFLIVRPGLSSVAAAGIARIDLWYGILATAVLVLGFCPAVFAAKGWAYYSHNAFFWAKIGAFAAVGLLSVPPTLEFIRWRKSATAPADAGRAVGAPLFAHRIDAVRAAAHICGRDGTRLRRVLTLIGGRNAWRE